MISKLNPFSKTKENNNKKVATNVVTSKKPSTQEWIPVKDVTNGFIERKDQYQIGVVQIEPINMYLLSEKEQKRIIKALNGVLNGYDFVYDWHTLPKPVDLDNYINDLIQKRDQETDFIRRKILDDDIKNAVAMASEGEASDREFYFIHSYKSTKNKAMDENILYKRSLEIATDFTNIGLRAVVSQDQNIRDLLFVFTNPTQASFERAPSDGPYLPPFYKE